MCDLFWKSAFTKSNHALSCNGDSFTLYKGNSDWHRNLHKVGEFLISPSLFYCSLAFFLLAFLLLLPNILCYQVLFLLHNSASLTAQFVCFRMTHPVEMVRQGNALLVLNND